MRTCIMLSPPHASGIDWETAVRAKPTTNNKHSPGGIMLKNDKMILRVYFNLNSKNIYRCSKFKRCHLLALKNNMHLVY